MPLCALVIGDHVWKVVGRPHFDINIEELWRKPLPSNVSEPGETSPGCRFVFQYVRTNINGMHEYQLIDIRGVL